MIEELKKMLVEKDKICSVSIINGVEKELNYKTWLIIIANPMSNH